MKRPRNIHMQHWDYMLSLHQFGGMSVTAGDVVAAGQLIEMGYAIAEQEHDGPRLILTPKWFEKIEAGRP